MKMANRCGRSRYGELALRYLIEAIPGGADAATLTIFPEIDVIAPAGQRIVMAAQRGKIVAPQKAMIGLRRPRPIATASHPRGVMRLYSIDCPVDFRPFKGFDYRAPSCSMYATHVLWRGPGRVSYFNPRVTQMIEDASEMSR